MKSLRLTLILFFALCCQEIYGQAKGNVSQRRQEYVQQQSYYNFLTERPQAPRTPSGFINDSTFEIQTRLLMNVEADTYVAILSLRQAAKTATECNQTAERRIQAFTQTLLSNKLVSPEDIYIDFIAQVPTYTYEIEKKIFSKTANEVPTGFELSKNIHIRFAKAETLDMIMIEAAKQEIYELVKVDYVVSQEKLNQIYDSLRNVAVSLTEAKTKDFERLGFSFSGDHIRYKTLKETLASSYPLERYESYTAYRSAQLPQTDFKETTRASKAKTYFYEKLPYNTYDRVLHPEVLAPAVQFSYELRTRYVLER